MYTVPTVPNHQKEFSFFLKNVLGRKGVILKIEKKIKSEDEMKDEG
jgi:hypothetical protein